MNKNLFFSIILLTSLSFNVQARTKLDLEDPLLRIVDGIPGAMDAVAFKQCFDTWSVINDVQYKNTYVSNEKSMTLKDVVIKEKQYKAQGILKTDSGYTQLLKTLEIIKDDFSAKTTALLEQAKSTPKEEENNKKLIQLWIKKQKRTDSLLATWGSVDEKTLLASADCKTFFVFLNDLKYFLEDLMFSCKKARTAFKQECLKESDHDSFEKFFTN